MSNLRRVLERQEREEEEIRHKHAEEDHELDEVEEEMVVTVCMLNESRQHHRHLAPNMDRHRHSRGKNLLEDYFIPNSLYHKYDVVGGSGLLPEQKLTSTLRMLAYGAFAEQVDEIARMGKSTILKCLVKFCDAIENPYSREYLRKPTARDLRRLVQKAEARGFAGMIGSIDCMHWQWKNCPTAWQGDYGNRKDQKSIIMEAVASFDTWVWHSFFGVIGSQNDLNVLS
ncbi:unnamed protein product [Prunus armeniaca]